MLSQQTAGEAAATAGASGSSPAETESLPLDQVSPQFTGRAILTGAVLGGLLSVCNVYLGLKSGLVINMSLVAALLGYGFWSGVRGASGGRVRSWGLLENNINQTASSAGASVASAGLVHAVPALAMMTGQTLSLHLLVLWIFSVCLVGITVAVALRRHLVLVSKLPFPVGMASAEMLREMHSRGTEALARVITLVSFAAVAAGVYLVKVCAHLRPLDLPFFFRGISAKVLTFSISPGLFWAAVGGLIGFRAGASIMVGCIFALGVLAPALVENGTIQPTVTEPLAELPVGVIIGGRAADAVSYDPAKGVLRATGIVGREEAANLRSRSDDAEFRAAVDALAAKSRAPAEHVSYSHDLLPWLMWPGVALMVSASLTYLALSWRSAVAALRGFGRSRHAPISASPEEVSRRSFVGLLALALILSVVLQVSLFGIGWLVAVAGVLLAFVLAVVAARVSGETGITPVGSMGKMSQIVFGALVPKNPVPNLMAANVAGGAASQCADLLHDLKCGHLLGASARLQAAAQIWGAMAGALVGSVAYLILVPNPAEQLVTPEWPAPGALVWKAVAELFKEGFGALPDGAPLAMLLGAVAGVVLTAIERVIPGRFRPFMLSPASVGLAFVIPASMSMPLFLGGTIALILTEASPGWSKRFLVAACAGIIAGESLTGVGHSFYQYLSQ